MLGGVKGEFNQSSSNSWKVFARIVSMTRTCHPASAMLPPELAPMRVGLDMRVNIEVQHEDTVMHVGLPEANSNVAGVHAVLHIVLLDFVQVLIMWSQ